MSETDHDTAGVIAPPPLIFLTGQALGWLLDRAWRHTVVPRAWSRALGMPLVGSGAGLVVWALTTMIRARTHPDPRQPTTAIVAHGPFRYTRNPIYLAFTLIYLGLSLWRNSLTTLLLLPGVLTVLWRGVVEREERYLERKFGAEYTSYKARVRRWL